MKNDEKIKELLKETEGKQKKLSKTKVLLETNGLFKFNDGRSLNINTVSDIDTLVLALAHLIENKNNFEAAAKILKYNIPFNWYGFSFSQWVTDFKNRADHISAKQQSKKLDKIKGKLNDLVSEEARTEMELEKIIKELKG